MLSSGEQTRVCLAKAMLNQPHLLLLDEPTASLDPATARDIRQKHLHLCQRKVSSGVLWTSHNMHEVEEVCDRVLFMSRGQDPARGGSEVSFRVTTASPPSRNSSSRWRASP